MRLTPLWGLTLTTTSVVNAISLKLAGRGRDDSVGLYRKRDTSSIQPGTFGNGSSSLIDMTDLEYACNITLGGIQFEVQIDTGSADLWVIGSVPGALQTDSTANFSYGIGSVAGNISTATLVFDDFRIENQAYLNATSFDQQPITTPGTGLIGLGPSPGSGSTILQTLGSPAGDTPLDRIFRQNTSTPNLISILLSRTDENSTTSSDTLVPLLDEQPGQLTIGEIIPEYQDITKTTKLPALLDTVSTNEHWMTTLDSNGIIGPDGNRINTTSSFSGDYPQVKNDQYIVVFDSGFSRPQVPPAVTDAFYGRVPGAQFFEEYSLWQLPCDYELNVSFVFADTEFYIHPLDLTQFAGQQDGEEVCIGWFQPIAENIASNPASFGAFDAILGMAFLRNGYLLINFGDFVDGSNSSVADPYIQLLPTLNRTAAHLDFVNTRLGGIDTTGSQQPLVSVSEGQSSTTDSDAANDSEDIAHSTHRTTSTTNGPVYQKIWFIIVVSVVGAIVLACLAWAIYTRVRRTRRSNIRTENAFVPPMGSYKPLIMKDDGAEFRVPLSQYPEPGSNTAYHDPYSDA